jgi:hypothetical protein
MAQTTWTIKDYCDGCGKNTRHLVVKQGDKGYHVENVRECKRCGHKRVMYTDQETFRDKVMYAALIIVLVIFFGSFTSCSNKTAVIPHDTSDYELYVLRSLERHQDPDATPEFETKEDLFNWMRTDTVIVKNPFEDGDNGEPKFIKH